MSHFVLADCNNFYVSCERVFNPWLEGKRVVVLSSNDGCIVARSQEAKQIGIPMGVPFFQVKEYCERSKVVVYSSNYSLYGDISRRVMNILSQEAPEIEIYSIDEAFLKYPEGMSSEDLYFMCTKLRKMLKKWVGIPVSFGFASTKTLAKIANSLAKKNRDLGVVNLNDPSVKEEVLKGYPLKEVWGIGTKLSERLRNIGIFTAWDFSQQDPYFVRAKMGVVGERILWELRGRSCLELQKPSSRKNICVSRSFGRIVTEISDLQEAVATFTSRACVKLREQKGCACAVYVYLESMIDGKRRQFSMTNTFPNPSNDTPKVISAAKECLNRIFKPSERYKKCGIILLDLIPENNVIPDLFLGLNDPKRRKAMHLVDSLNTHFGKDTLFFGAVGVKPTWSARSDKRSKYHTTNWESLPIAVAR